MIMPDWLLSGSIGDSKSSDDFTHPVLLPMGSRSFFPAESQPRNSLLVMARLGHPDSAKFELVVTSMVNATNWPLMLGNAEGSVHLKFVWILVAVSVAYFSPVAAPKIPAWPTCCDSFPRVFRSIEDSGESLVGAGAGAGSGVPAEALAEGLGSAVVAGGAAGVVADGDVLLEPVVEGRAEPCPPFGVHPVARISAVDAPITSSSLFMEFSDEVYSWQLVDPSALILAEGKRLR